MTMDIKRNSNVLPYRPLNNSFPTPSETPRSTPNLPKWTDGFDSPSNSGSPIQKLLNEVIRGLEAIQALINGDGPSRSTEMPSKQIETPTKHPMTESAGGSEKTVQPGSVDDDLGSLSAKYESNGDPGTVSSGAGDAGGVSYGSYQFATNTGSAQRFVDGLKTSHPEYYERLKDFKPGTTEFSNAWKQLAKDDPTGFAKAQHEAIASSHYQPAMAKIEEKHPDFSKRSSALRNVIWSAAVQHGSQGCANIVDSVLSGKDVSKMSDEEIIKAIYAERGRTNANGGLVHFPSCSSDVQESVKNRFQNECNDALAQLKSAA